MQAIQAVIVLALASLVVAAGVPLDAEAWPRLRTIEETLVAAGGRRAGPGLLQLGTCCEPAQMPASPANAPPEGSRLGCMMLSQRTATASSRTTSA